MTIDRIVLWGTADFGKPRTRILAKGLRERGVVVGECLYDIWGHVEEKSGVKGAALYARYFLNYLIAYPVLIWRYLRAPRHDAVFVAYMGHFDVLVLWPFAKMRGAKIVWDAFLSLYDTVVEDRKLVRKGGFVAGAVSFVEGLSCKAADAIVLDTEAHASYFKRRYKIPDRKMISVWVGAETDVFQPAESDTRQTNQTSFNVLFYGQFIPLHGLEHIVDAVRQCKDPHIRWTIIGQGQEAEKIDQLIEETDLSSLTRIDWVDYDELPAAIANADLCLGVFGSSDKAARVIPNKVFQILSVGRPLLTMDSPAIREIVSSDTPGVWLVKPADSVAIAEAAVEAKHWRDNGGRSEGVFSHLRDKITPDAIGEALAVALNRRFEAVH